MGTVEPKAGPSNAAESSGNQTLYNISDINLSEICDESVLALLDEPFECHIDGSKLRNDEKYFGFDNNTGDNWIYPTNYPIRQYQYNISRMSLFRNTLVVLPTGLGKTFIAAVVMYNIYRWYPTGKVIFMAPTRPLVAQQINACYNIMGIPMEDTAEMTGKQLPKLRSKLWQSKRVFFVTPQVVLSDLNSPDQNFPMSNIKLIVVDEAHRAKGKYAYTEVVQAIASRNPYFRVLALSATPGRKIEDVAEVVRNLLISHIEVRWENSIDVFPYIQKKHIKTVVVPLGDQLREVRDKFIEIIDPYVRNLLDYNVISGNTGSLNKGWLLMEQQKFREISLTHRHPHHSVIMSDLSTCISLYHALELLTRHGLRSFLNFFDESEEKYFVAKDGKLKMFINNLRNTVGPNPFDVNDETMPNGVIPHIPDHLDFGHPKFKILQKHIVDHFENNNESRAIVFCEFRESVYLLHRLLLQNRPLIRPKIFVGQGSSAGIKSVTQKQQIAIMNDFRNGTCNTLVATCVAEEGIDVGEVDLIVCFDISTKNPTRFVQRIGRTGRKKQGKVLMLVTEGKEHDVLKEVLATKDKTNQKISKSTEILRILYNKAPRLVPPEFDPKCLETFMKIKEIKTPERKNRKQLCENDSENETAPISESKKKKTNSKNRKMKQMATGMKDMRQFFKTVDLDKNDKEIFCTPKTRPNFSKVLEENLNILDNENTSAIDGLNNNEQKLNRILNKIQILIGTKYKNIVLSVQEIIHNPNYSTFLKKIMLETNYEFIQSRIESEQILQVAMEDNEDIIAENELQLRKDVSVIDDIFGGRQNVLSFLKVKAEEKKYLEFLNTGKGIQPDHLNRNMENVKTIFNKLAGLECSETNSSNSSFSHNSTYCEYSLQDNSIDPLMFCDGESKYKSQFLTQCEEKATTSRDCANLITTPATTDYKTPRQKNFSLLIKDSPLMKAFERSVNKKANSDTFSSSSNGKLKEKMTLEYFGLGSWEDLFDDINVEKEAQKVIKIKNSGRKLYENIFDEVEESVLEFSEITDEKIDNQLNIDIYNNNSIEEEEIVKMVSQNIFALTDEHFKKSSSLDKRMKAEINESNSDDDDDIVPCSQTNPIVRNILMASNKEFPVDESDLFPPSDGLNRFRYFSSTGDRELTNLKVSLDAFDGKNVNGDKQQMNVNTDNISTYSVSKILKIVEEDEREQMSNISIPNATKNMTKELFSPYSTDSSGSLILNKNMAKFDLVDLDDLDDIFESDEDFADDIISNLDKKPDAKVITARSNTNSNIDQISLSTNEKDDKDNDKNSNKVEEINDSTISKSCKNNSSSSVLFSTIETDFPKENIPNDAKELKSPSVLSRRIKLSNLKNYSSRKSLSLLPPTTQSRSPYFHSCESKNLGVVDQNFLDESIIGLGIVPSRNKQTIESSAESDDEDEVFETCRTSNLRSSHDKEKAQNHVQENGRNKRRKRRKKINPFLDLEAEHSGNDSHEDDNDEENLDILDSIIVDTSDDEIENADKRVNMQAIYLQSIRSPIKRPNTFKIPDRRQYKDRLNIFSQPVIEESFSAYKEDSFVVDDDEDEDIVYEISKLEKAEAILNEERRQRKRLRCQSDLGSVQKVKRKKRIILNSDDSSDDEMNQFRRKLECNPDL